MDNLYLRLKRIYKELLNEGRFEVFGKLDFRVVERMCRRESV